MISFTTPIILSVDCIKVAMISLVVKMYAIVPKQSKVISI